MKVDKNMLKNEEISCFYRSMHLVRWHEPISVLYGTYKVLLLFLYHRGVLFKNLLYATLSSLGNPHNMQIKAAITEYLVFVNISVTMHGIIIILVSNPMF